jgi:hypothetical protein
MQSYDIRWDQVVDSYFSESFDSTGKKTRDAYVTSTDFPNSSTTTHSADNVNTWVFVGAGSSKYSWSPSFSQGAQGKLPLGISAFNFNQKDPNGFGGLQRVGSGGYQGFGSASGPTFENNNTVFIARVSNFQIRRHGSGEPWQPSDPGKGQDGDVL